MSYTSHISADARSAIARLNGRAGGNGRAVWTKRRKRRARELQDDGFSYSEIGTKMRTTREAVAGMFHREKARRQ